MSGTASRRSLPALKQLPKFLLKTTKLGTLYDAHKKIWLTFRQRGYLGANLSLWSDLRKLWRDLARAQLTFWDGDDEDEEGNTNKEDDLRKVCGSLAKVTRNLVAGVPENQARA